MLEAVDHGVGRILQAVARVGLTDNTIVIFTNDNGGEWLSNNGPLFNRKWTVWEGGIRVPAIVKWPGRIRAGRVSDQAAITFDWSSSILAAAGVDVPSNYEGMNLFPILEGRVPKQERGSSLPIPLPCNRLSKPQKIDASACDPVDDVLDRIRSEIESRHWRHDDGAHFGDAGHARPGFFRDQSACGNIPGVEGHLPETIKAACRHVTQIDRRRAEPADSPGEFPKLHKVGEVILWGIPGIVRKSGHEQAFL